MQYKNYPTPFVKLLGLTLSIITCWSNISCSDFLDQYSQDLVMAKSITDLNELLIGDVYLRSTNVTRGASQRTLAFINILDDDLNTTSTSLKGNVANSAWSHVLSPLYGYITWQQDVRYNYGATTRNDDATTWKQVYTRINHANNIIDIIDDMPKSSEDDKALYHRVKGEAHFLRGQFYFVLANLYAHPFHPDSASKDLCVPLKLSPNVEHDKHKDTQFERATVQQVYDQIVADLVTAEQELTTSEQPKRYRLHRASAEAAQLLLSRVYLYRQEWAKAEEMAKKVMQSNNFSLTTLNELGNSNAFLVRNNPEIIFSQGANYIAPQETRTSFSGEPGDFCVTRELYDLYSTDDIRRQAFFSITASTDSIKLTNKYERGLELNHISDGWMLRLSEAYLNFAEATAMQGKDADANQTLNLFRQQRIANYTSTNYTAQELIDEIRTERRRELCFEGHRWFDLRRYSVNTQYPLKKDIHRSYSVYNDSWAFLTTLYFTLPTGDPAWTFAIPSAIIEFDKVPMPNNYRPRREAIKTPKPIGPSLPTLPSDSTATQP